MTTDTGFAAFDRFISEMHEYLAKPSEGLERWQGTAAIFRRLITDREFRSAGLDWVSPGGDLVLYEDPEYGFVVNALVKGAGSGGSVHDHGMAYTVYGCLHGNETITHFERADDGPQAPSTAELRKVRSFEVFSGDVDLLPPWVPHSAKNGPAKTIAIVLWSDKPGTVAQNRFDLEAGAVEQTHGATQVAFDLGTGRVV
ncbi:MAG: hypothetical protein O3B65_01400 [Chloroflexi bacterium]|nr:hypothetical protein [Chloroflexota bacterium]